MSSNHLHGRKMTNPTPGGISFLSHRYGWALDNVRNFEVSFTYRTDIHKLGSNAGICSFSSALLMSEIQPFI